MSDDTLDPGAPSEAEWLPIRASLRDVAVPAKAREQALAAALGVFDELQATTLDTVTDAAEPPVSLATHRARRYRWLTGAAAAVAVADAIAVAVLRAAVAADAVHATITTTTTMTRMTTTMTTRTMTMTMTTTTTMIGLLKKMATNKGNSQ